LQVATNYLVNLGTQFSNWSRV